MTPTGDYSRGELLGWRQVSEVKCLLQVLWARLRRTQVQRCSLILLVLIMPVWSAAQTRDIWDGPPTGNWFDANNWQCLTSTGTCVPQGNAIGLILESEGKPVAVTINQNLSIAAIGNSGGDTIISGTSLSLTGTIVSDLGTAKVSNGGVVTGVNLTEPVLGDITDGTCNNCAFSGTTNNATLNQGSAAGLITTSTLKNVAVAGQTTVSDSTLTGGSIQPLGPREPLTLSNSTATGTAIYSQGPLTLDRSHVVNAPYITVDSGGSLTLSDDASATTSGFLTVGYQAAGPSALNVEAGSSLRAMNANIGANSLSSGAITVSSSDAELNLDGYLTVGSSGTGTLTVTYGGYVGTDAGLTIGFQAAKSPSAVTVTGAGSQLESDGYLSVGYAGTGSLSIINGGLVTSQSGDLGVVAGGTGTATVNGTGSKWQVDKTLYVGDAGTGTLNIQKGAVVTVGGNVVMANQSTSQATSATVTGTGPTDSPSTWSIGGSLVVGNAGPAQLTVAAGGVVDVVGGATIGRVGNTGFSLVSVDGATSQLNLNTSSLSINNGKLLVENGAAVYYDHLTSTSGTTIDVETGGNLVGTLNLIDSPGGPTANPDMIAAGATATVNGPGSTWFAKSGLNVLGALTISGGGQVNTAGQNFYAGSAGQPNNAAISVTGTGSLLAASGVGLSGSSSLSISAGASAQGTDLSIGDKATANVDNGSLHFSDGIGVGTTAGAASTLDVTKGGNVIGPLMLIGIKGTGTVNVSSGGELFSSLLSVENGSVQIHGILSASQLQLGGFGNSALLTVGTGGELINAIVEVNNQGTFTVSGGAAVGVGSRVSLSGGGTVNVEAGALTIGVGEPVEAEALFGNLNVNLFGTLSGGTVTAEKFAGAGGTVLGNVIVAGGTVSPSDPETFDISGNYKQTSGLLDLDIDGAEPGQFDRLITGGSIQIGSGTLRLDFGDGFAPTKGMSFDLLDASKGLSLANTQIQIEGLAPGFEYSVNVADGQLDITALNNGVSRTSGSGPTGVPEPATILLLLPGIGLTLLRRSRR